MPMVQDERLVMSNKCLYDISPEINADIAVFPGDKPFERIVSRDYEQGDNYTLSAIHTTVHLGAHTDAPNHYDATGSDIASRDLEYYYGRAQVISVCNKPPNYRIQISDLANTTINASRLLFRTDSFTNPYQWRDDFTALSPEVIDYLAGHKVKLIGIDTPSVDIANDEELITHHCIAKYDMAILEGIVLTHIDDGLYHLCALPLKIKGADASPVRAILMDYNQSTTKE